MKINQKLILQEEQNEGILFDPDSLLTAWLNESSLIIWKDLNAGLAVDAILKHLLETFEDVTLEQVETDYNELIQNLCYSGFIESEDFNGSI